MRIRRLSVLVGVLVLSSPFATPVAMADDATAQTEVSTANPVSVADDDEVPANKPEKPKMVCKKEPATGSAIPKKVCRTPYQIQMEREAAQKNMDRVNDGQERPTQSGG
jgi:hypothetical protein